MDIRAPPFWYPLFLPGDLCSDNIMVSLDVALPPGIIILESGCQHGGAEVNET